MHDWSDVGFAERPGAKMTLTAKQKEAAQLLLSRRRHTLLAGGARSGKTTLLVRAIADRALLARRSRHAILRLRANAARASIALDTLPKVFRLCFPGEELRAHRRDGYFSLRNESEIWIGGLDDRQRVEKILGKEYATIFLNECSQIPYSSVLVALTRLAQVVEGLPQAAYYDLNPTSKAHWTNVLFGEKRDPLSRTALVDPDDYARMFINPSDNEHLTREYLASLAHLPERARKRFFEGIYIEDLDGALFSYEAIAGARVEELAPARRQRILVAVDPSGAADRDDESADEIGIVVVAKGDDGHAYVLADRSLRDAPGAWGRAVVNAYHEFDADCVIAEGNFGGEMVRYVIRAADQNIALDVIAASRGKHVRAEPVAALYEQGKVHHVGRFPALEDQLCAFTSSGYRGEGSPDRADALVWAVTTLMLDRQEGLGIFEYFREEAEAAQAGGAPAKIAAAAAVAVRLRAPAGISNVYGRSGRAYNVGADRIVEVADEDATPLLAQGFEQVEETAHG